MTCSDGQFQCASGTCIDDKWHCDGTVHCFDFTDELHCENGNVYSITQHLFESIYILYRLNLVGDTRNVLMDE